MNRKTILICVSLIIALAGLTTALPQVNQVLLKGTIEACESLIFPSADAKVNYDNETKEVYVVFTTPASYKINYGDFYLRWRDNQWVVLQEFKKAKIKVNQITVETNHHDMSGQVKVTHLPADVDKYAKLPSDDMWLRTGTMYQKSKGSDKWEKVRY